MMSSETSTEHAQRRAEAVRLGTQPAMQPWQFFVLAGLGCATAATFVVRGQSVTVVLLLSMLMAATVLVGIAALRAIRPLVAEHEDHSRVVGQRTRVALEQEKALALRTIKELEFDRAMGKVSEDDFREMSVRLRARAARLIKQLDAGTGYRGRIEQDLAKRLGDTAPQLGHDTVGRACAKCQTRNDSDARFCKSCGERLG